MSVRSPTEDENGKISLRMVLPATRHSRARGNPGLFSAELTWIPAGVYPERSRRAGMTEPSGSWMEQRVIRSLFYRSSPHRYFRRRSRRTRRVRTIKTPPCGLKPSGDRPNFVLFVLLSMIIAAACANLSGAEASSDSDMSRARDAKFGNKFFSLRPLRSLREIFRDWPVREAHPTKSRSFLSLRLSAFAGDIPKFGCGVAAPGPSW